jgi:SAM-dependent methyltransferase
MRALGEELAGASEMDKMAGAKKSKRNGQNLAEGEVDAAATPAPAQEKARVEDVLAFLATNPDLDSLLAAFPSLTIDEVKQIFSQASEALQGVRTVQRRKGASKTEIVRTHGLPEPDGSLHKANIFRAMLAPLKPGRMLDLGAGKGNFALIATEKGWQVTAVDARTVRWPDAETEEDPRTAELIRSIEWVQSDVREFPIGRGDFDLICILGLLHHLEVPDQIQLITRCAGTPLIIDTRIAVAIVDREGDYEGILIREHGETPEERDEVPTASWGNATSFRHTEESLVRLLRNCGFPQVLMMRPPHRRDYSYYVALPRDKSDAEDPNSRRSRKKKPVGHGRGVGTWAHWVPDRDDASQQAAAEPATSEAE